MKKLLFIFLLFSAFNMYGQNTALDRLKSKISATIATEMPKYTDFGSNPRIWKIEVIDAVEKEGKYIVDGEYSFWPEYPDGNAKTIKIQAEVKVILDDFSVIKVIYEKGGKWFKLFPANEF